MGVGVNSGSEQQRHTSPLSLFINFLGFTFYRFPHFLPCFFLVFHTHARLYFVDLEALLSTCTLRNTLNC